MSVSHGGDILVSASKARDAAAARILLWSNSFDSGSADMRLVCGLAGHESTVVCLQFSPNDR